jgi:hypothetical protein
MSEELLAARAIAREVEMTLGVNASEAEIAAWAKIIADGLRKEIGAPTADMIAAGRRIVEEEAIRFWFSSRDDAAWTWFLTKVYAAMRESEPLPLRGARRWWFNWLAEKE